MTFRLSGSARRTLAWVAVAMSFCVPAVWAVSPAITSGPATDFKWDLNFALSYVTGDYGEEEDTDMVYVPLTVKRLLSKGDVSLVIPYLDVESEGDVVIVDGRPQEVEDGSGSSSGSGLGDLILKGRYYLHEQDERWPYVDLVGRLKLPTADEDEGLGTGEVDFGAGAEVSQWFRSEYFAFVDLTYNVIGEPADTDYDNQIVFDCGAGWQATRELQLSAMFEHRDAISSGSSDSQSLMFHGSYRQTKELKFYGLLELGMSDGAPDYSLTAGVSRRL